MSASSGFYTKIANFCRKESCHTKTFHQISIVKLCRVKTCNIARHLLIHKSTCWCFFTLQKYVSKYLRTTRTTIIFCKDPCVYICMHKGKMCKTKCVRTPLNLVWEGVFRVEKTVNYFYKPTPYLSNIPNFSDN